MPDSIDRGMIRSMVEDFFRSHLTTSAVNPSSAKESVQRFGERAQAMASLMPAARADEFLRVVAEEIELIDRENARDPELLKMRLGLKVQRDHQTDPVLLVPSRQRQSLGELAVRTAVRATVWKSIGAAFRLFR